MTYMICSLLCNMNQQFGRPSRRRLSGGRRLPSEHLFCYLSELNQIGKVPSSLTVSQTFGDHSHGPRH